MLNYAGFLLYFFVSFWGACLIGNDRRKIIENKIKKKKVFILGQLATGFIV
jgi:hypothetical protein